MKTKHSTAFWLLEAISLFALLAMLIVLARYWNEIPAIIPTHFDIHGHANKLGRKHVLLVLACIDLASYALLCFAARYQKLVNLPITVDRNAPSVQERIRSMIAAIKAIATVSSFYIIWIMIQTAAGRSKGLGAGFFPISSGALVVTLVFYISSFRRDRN